MKKSKSKLLRSVSLGHAGHLPRSAGTDIGTKAFINAMLAGLSQRERRLIAGRFGLWDGIPKTLQEIGDRFGVTRERIRQIEAKGLTQLRRLFGPNLVSEFVSAKIKAAVAPEFERNCGVLSEEEAVAAMGDDCTVDEAASAAAFFQNIFFEGKSPFSGRMVQVEQGVYCVDSSHAGDYLKVLRLVRRLLRQQKGPSLAEELYRRAAKRPQGPPGLECAALIRRVVAVSPSVACLREGVVASAEWKPSSRRRSAANLAEVVLATHGRPAHFREITRKIHESYAEFRRLNERVVHNALIAKRETFVWVKSGTYGLKSWGLKRPPYIKDRLIQLLSETRDPVPYRHLKERVLEVCNCTETSVRMTLDLNPRVFRKFENDQYGLSERYAESTDE